MNYLLPPFHRRTWSARWVGHNTQHLRGVNCIINAFHPPKFSPFSSQSFKLVGGWTTHLKHMLVKNGCIFPKFRGEHWKYMWNQHLGPRKVNRTNWSMRHVQVIVSFHVLILTLLVLVSMHFFTSTESHGDFPNFESSKSSHRFLPDPLQRLKKYST